MALRKYSKCIVLASTSRNKRLAGYNVWHAYVGCLTKCYFYECRHQILFSCLQLMRSPCWSLTTARLSWSAPATRTEKRGRLYGEGGSKKRGRLCRENESEKVQGVMTAKDKQLDLSDIVRIRNWLHVAPRSMQRAEVFFRITEWCIMKRCKNHLFV